MGEHLNFGWTFDLWVNFWNMGGFFLLWWKFLVVGKNLNYGWTFCIYVTPPLGLKKVQRIQLSHGVGGKLWCCDFLRETVEFVLKKEVKWSFFGALKSSALSSHKYYSFNWKGIDTKFRCSEMLGPLAFRCLNWITRVAPT